MQLKFLWNVAIVLAAICTNPGQLYAAGNSGLKERYLHAETLRQATGQGRDTVAAFEILRNLAMQDYARAQDKLGYYHLRGIGTPVNLDQAAHWYNAAIANGREASRLSYAKLLIKTGNLPQALEQFSMAADLNLPGAQAELAANHLDGSFADWSDPDFGKQQLELLSRALDEYAIRHVLIRLSKGAKFNLDQEVLLSDALNIARDPENRFHVKIAEALVPYLRMSASKNSLALRKELLATPNLRQKIWISESLYLTAEEHPKTFWRNSEHIVSKADQDTYARALFMTSRINKNAYVKILQAELRKRAYFNRRPTGYLTDHTIRSITKFCSDHEINDICRNGPLKSNTIKAISLVLAKSI